MAQESDTSYLFVSYASRDQDRVLPVVDRLNRLGIRFWIDRYQIQGGADYSQEVPRAIGKAHGVIVFLSTHAFASKNVKKELNIAWKKDKPVLPLLLEKVEIPDDFLYNLEAVQSIAMFGEGEARWLQAVQQALQSWKIDCDIDPWEENGGTTLVREVQSRNVQMAASPLVPYLVDRIQQERELHASLAEHCREHSRRPIVFLVYGRADQAIHEYLERLEKISLPKALRRLDYADVVKWINLPWGHAPDWYDEIERTLRSLCEDVEVRLELKPGAWPNGLVQFAANLRATLVFCYRLRWESWGNAHLETLRAWALDWGGLPNLPSGHPLVIFFTIEYASAKPNLFQRMLRKQTTEHPIREQLSRLLQVNGHGLTVTLLAELGNVTLQDVEDWILNEVRPPNPAGMIRLAHQALEDPDLLTQGGVPMGRLAQHLARLIEQAGRGSV
jgi:hypothetical protein